MCGSASMLPRILRVCIGLRDIKATEHTESPVSSKRTKNSIFPETQGDQIQHCGTTVFQTHLTAGYSTLFNYSEPQQLHNLKLCTVKLRSSGE